MSASSVRVSWDSVDTPEITGYTVYYSQAGNTSEEGNSTVSNTANSVVIESLMSNVEYQLQVVAIAELDGDVRMGERSMLTVVVVTIPTTTPSTPPETTSASVPCE